MASNGKNLGQLSIEIRTGDQIMLGNAIELRVVRHKRGAVRLKIVAPRAVLINYQPKRIYREPTV